jgi:integrase
VIIIKAPNGYGSVTKLSGNRRKPYWVKKTIGWNEKGHPIYKTIGYATTREEGNILLAQYNHNPWDVDTAKVTLQELFDIWKEKKMSKLAKGSQAVLTSTFKHLGKYKDMKYKEIKAFHMQDTIDHCGKGYSTQGAIKSLWGHLDKLAKEMDISHNGYSDLLTSDSIPETTRTRFTDEEIERLWEMYEKIQKGEDLENPNIEVEFVDTILIFIYSGFRITELLGMKLTDINLEEEIFTGGVKTKAGKNRIVPIHSLIKPMVQRRIEQSKEYFIEFNGSKMTCNTYRRKFASIVGSEKTPHEARHTFESLLDSAGANRKCIDLMMGHKSKDTGNRIYNHKSIEELKEAIELVTR